MWNCQQKENESEINFWNPFHIFIMRWKSSQRCGINLDDYDDNEPSELPDYHLGFRPLGFIHATKHFNAKENFDICLFSFCQGAFMIRDKCLPPLLWEERFVFEKIYFYIGAGILYAAYIEIMSEASTRISCNHCVIQFEHDRTMQSFC